MSNHLIGRPIRFARFLREHNLRLPEQHQAVCRGARIHPQAVEVFQRAALAAGLGSSVHLADGLRYFELEALLRDPGRLRLALEVDKEASVVRINTPRTKEELAVELEQTFARDHSAGIALLQDLKDALSEADYEYCFRETLFAALKGFGEERHEAADFTFLLQELTALGDHELNLKAVAELNKTKEHDVVWAMWALIELREAFPQEVQYHREYGELNYKYKVYDEAIVGFKAALALAPEPETAKPARPSQLPAKNRPGRKRKISRSRKKTAKARPAPQTLTAKLQEAERLQLRQQERTVTELRKELRTLWPRFKAGQAEPAKRLREIIAILGQASFTVIYRTLREAPRVRLAKLDYLCDLYLEDGLTEAADSFQRLADEMIEKLFDNIVRGRSFGRETMETVNIRELGIRTERNFYPMPESAALLIELLREDQLEVVSSRLVVKLGELSNELADKGSADAREVVRYIVAKYFSDVIVQKQPANLAELYAVGGLQLADERDYAKAKAAFARALAADPGCVLALEQLAVIANIEEDFSAALDYAQQIIDKSPTPEGLFDQARPKIAYGGVIMDESAPRLFRSARLQLSFAAMTLYEAAPQAELLDRTIAALEPLVGQSDLPSLADTILINAYLYSGQCAEGLKATLGYWSRLSPGETVPEGFFEFVNERTLNYLQSQAAYEEQLAVDLVNHGIYLIECGRLDLAQPIFEFLGRLENRGTDSYSYAHYGRALAAYRAGDYSVCQERLQIIITADDVSLEIYSHELLGDSSLKANAYNLLLQTYRSQEVAPPKNVLDQAMAEFPDEPVILNVAGVIYDEAGELSQARQALERGIALAPQFPDLHLNYLDMVLKQQPAGTIDRTEIDRVMRGFQTNVEQALERAQTDINEIGSLDTARFLEFVVDLYFNHRYEPLLELLRTMLQAELPLDLNQRLSRVLERAGERAEAAGQSLPKELFELVS